MTNVKFQMNPQLINIKNLVMVILSIDLIFGFCH